MRPVGQTPRRGLLAALAALLVVCCLAAASSTALAGGYCNIGVAPMSQCAQSSGVAQWKNNHAIYTGSGTVSVCQKEVAAAPYAGYQLSRTCGNSTASGYASDGWSGLGYNEDNVVGNNSAYAHTIAGITEPFYGFARQARGDSGLAEITGTTIAAEDAPAAARAQLGVLRGESSAGRVATIAQPDDQIALRTTTKGICLDAAQVGGEITCQDYERTLTGGLLAAAICGPDQPAGAIVLYGVAPDAVSSVAAQTATGVEIATAPVTGNTFRLQLSTDEAAAAARLQQIGGEVLPLDVIPEDLAC